MAISQVSIITMPAVHRFIVLSALDTLCTKNKDGLSEIFNGLDDVRERLTKKHKHPIHKRTMAEEVSLAMQVSDDNKDASNAIMNRIFEI